MFKNLSKRDVMIIAILCAVVLVGLTLLIVITATTQDENRFVYELKGDDTYEVTDIKNTFRGGWFARDELVIPATHKGKDVTSIGSVNVVKKCKVTVSEGIVTIGDGAFSKSAIVSIKLPDSITRIGANAFSDCAYLAKINIPSVSALNNGTFSNCRSLNNITIPTSVTELGNDVFSGCTALTSLTVPDNVTSIGNNAFKDCSQLKTLVLSNGLVSIGESAFEGCAQLATLALPNNLTSLGASAFAGCAALTSITVPDGVTTIGNSTFRNCAQLTTLVLPNNLTAIGTNAFDGCATLQYNEHQDGKYLGSSANSYAVLVSAKENVTSLVVHDNTKIVYDSAFNNQDKLTTVTISQGVTVISNNAFDGCKALQSISVAAENANYSSASGILFNKQQTEFVVIPMAIVSANIPSTITAIPANAFANRTELASVSIPESVKMIGVGAFTKCEKLTSATFANTSGWSAGAIQIPDDALTNAANAAKLLTTDYLLMQWTHSAQTGA